MAAAVDSKGTSAVPPVKHQVVDKLPKRFKQLKFGIQSNQDIVKQAIVEVSDRQMYDVDKGREPTVNGVLDTRMVRAQAERQGVVPG